MKRAGKMLMKICLSIIIILICLLILVIGLRAPIFLTALSTKEISSAPASYNHIYGDMFFDDFLTQGASSPEELEKFLISKISFGLLKDGLNLDHGCSSFFAITPDHDYILAQNIDLSVKSTRGVYPFVSSYQINKKILGVSDLSSLTGKVDKMTFTNKLLASFAPYIAYTGMNEDGLAIALATSGGAKGKDNGKTNILDCSVSTLILSKASNVEEAIEVLEEYRVVPNHNSRSHFMIADSTGKCVVAEWPNGELEIIEFTDEYPIMANFLLYNNPDKNGYGRNRYLNYEEYLTNHKGVLTEEEALQLLKENTIPSDADFSVVYNLTKQTMKIEFAGDYGNTISFDLQ